MHFKGQTMPPNDQVRRLETAEIHERNLTDIRKTLSADNYCAVVSGRASATGREAQVVGGT